MFKFSIFVLNGHFLGQNHKNFKLRWIPEFSKYPRIHSIYNFWNLIENSHFEILDGKGHSSRKSYLALAPGYKKKLRIYSNIYSRGFDFEIDNLARKCQFLAHFKISRNSALITCENKIFGIILQFRDQNRIVIFSIVNSVGFRGPRII